MGKPILMLYINGPHGGILTITQDSEVSLDASYDEEFTEVVAYSFSRSANSFEFEGTSNNNERVLYLEPYTVYLGTTMWKSILASERWHAYEKENNISSDSVGDHVPLVHSVDDLFTYDCVRNCNHEKNYEAMSTAMNSIFAKMKVGSFPQILECIWQFMKPRPVCVREKAYQTNKAHYEFMSVSSFEEVKFQFTGRKPNGSLGEIQAVFRSENTMWSSGPYCLCSECNRNDRHPTIVPGEYNNKLIFKCPECGYEQIHTRVYNIAVYRKIVRVQAWCRAMIAKSRLCLFQRYDENDVLYRSSIIRIQAMLRGAISRMGLQIGYSIELNRFVAL